MFVWFSVISTQHIVRIVSIAPVNIETLIWVVAWYCRIISFFNSFFWWMKKCNTSGMNIISFLNNLLLLFQWGSAYMGWILVYNYWTVWGILQTGHKTTTKRKKMKKISWTRDYLQKIKCAYIQVVNGMSIKLKISIYNQTNTTLYFHTVAYHSICKVLNTSWTNFLWNQYNLHIRNGCLLSTLFTTSNPPSYTSFLW